MKRKLTSVLLAAILCLSFVGCAKQGDAPEDVNVTIWTVQTTEKILNDLSYSAQETAGRTLEIYAYRNDYEAGQIILTPSSDIAAYDIELSDLRTEDGNTLSASDFTVYNEKYYEIEENTHNTVSPLGMYPDALLPFETAKDYGENSIKAGHNQGIWLTLKTSDTQPAGVYTGSFSVICDGKDYSVPVSVTIWDTTVSEETHTRSLFDIGQYWSYGGNSIAALSGGEKDDSYAMKQKYCDFMLNYRLSGGIASYPTEEGYADALFEMALDDRCTTISIQTPWTWEWNDLLGGAEYGNDWVSYRNTLTRLAGLCIERYEETGEKFNVFDKAVTYFTLTDEAYLNNVMHRPNKVFSEVFEVQDELAVKWEDTLVCSNATFISELTDSMLNMEQLFCDMYTDELTVDNVTYCPTVDKYDTAYERAIYEEKSPGDKWWYTCSVPATPYPTYHIDDPQNMLSSRLLSWMQFDYDVVGNLYWTTTYFLKNVGSRAGLEALEDYYQGGQHYEGTNGDGHLLYPGAPYGIDGPVSSIRLESIRDGLEEYEVMYAYEQKALASDSEADVRAVLNYLYENMYIGTKVSTDSDTFLAARKSLAQLAVAADKNVAVTNVRTENGKQTFTVYAPSDLTVTSGGITLEGVVAGDNKRYEIEALQQDGTNVLDFTAGNVTVTLDLGGAETQVSAEDIAAQAEAQNATAVFTAAPEGSGLTGQVYGITATGSDASVTFTGDFFTSIDSDMTWVKLYVYAETDAQIQIMFRYSKQPVFRQYADLRLSAGINEIIINAAAIDFAQLGSIEAARLKLADGDTVYIVKGVVKQ